jgi:hypothetical protein
VGAAVDAHLGIDVQMGLIGMEARPGHTVTQSVKRQR